MAESSLINLCRAEIRWHRTTGVARDDQINTFFVGTDTENFVDLETATIGAIATIRNAIDGFMSSLLFTGAPLATYYTFNMLDAEPRQPQTVADMGAGTLSGAQPLPEEVTMVASFQGVPISGQSQRRRRGRLYLPTFTVDDLDASSSTIWDPDTIAAMCTMMSDVKDVLLTANCALSVFSRKAASDAGGTLLNQAKAGTTYVQSGWIDNEPDTQRRRGRNGGTKTQWT